MNARQENLPKVCRSKRIKKKGIEHPHSIPIRAFKEKQLLLFNKGSKVDYMRDFIQYVWFAILQLDEEKVKDIVCKGIPQKYHDIVIETVKEILSKEMKEKKSELKEMDNKRREG